MSLHTTHVSPFFVWDIKAFPHGGLASSQRVVFLETKFLCFKGVAFDRI